MSNIYEALERAQRERNSAVAVEMIPLGDITTGTKEIPTLPRPVSGEAMVGDEAIVDLYRSILDLLPEHEQVMVQFASSQSGEGVSTIVNEVARTVADRFSKKVLLVNATRSFEQNGSFSEEWESWNTTPDLCGGNGTACFQTKYNNLWVATLPVGRSAASYGDLDARVSQLKGTWQKFDLVLVDCPPLLEEPDSFELVRNVDGVVLVLEAERTKCSVAENVKERIVRNGGNILGVVFNKRRYHIPACIRNWLH